MWSSEQRTGSGSVDRCGAHKLQLRVYEWVSRTSFPHVFKLIREDVFVNPKKYFLHIEIQKLLHYTVDYQLILCLNLKHCTYVSLHLPQSPLHPFVYLFTNVYGLYNDFNLGVKGMAPHKSCMLKHTCMLIYLFPKVAIYSWNNNKAFFLPLFSKKLRDRNGDM